MIGLPSNRKCVSRRKFRISIRQPGGIQIQTALVFLNGRKIRVLTRKVFQKKRKVANVNLRGLPRGTFKVRIVVLTSRGQDAARHAHVPDVHEEAQVQAPAEA